MGLRISIFGLLLLILLGFSPRPSVATRALANYTCFNESYYQEGDTFKTNLDVLIQYLLSNTPVTLFSKSSVGQSPNSTVYGLMQCRGDITADACRTCTTNASISIFLRCPKSRSAAIWLEACFFHYSPMDFFGKIDASYKVFIADAKNSSDNTSSFLYWQPGYLVGNLINSVITDPSLRLFAVGNYPIGSSQRIYGLVQCSRDLTMLDCGNCLRNLTLSFPNQFDTRREFSMMTTTCVVWLGFQQFYVAQELPVVREVTSRRVVIEIILSLVSLLLVAALLIFLIMRRRCQEKECQEVTENDLREMRLLSEATSTTLGADYELPFICLRTVHAATSNFSDCYMLGKGGYGPVYRGELIGGQRIAIKRLAKGSGQGMEEFKNEVMLIAKLQHRNLVKLLGCCIENEERLLIYEYMSNGSLEKIIFDEKHRGQLNWKKRFNIISGIARGLLYLHRDSRLRIIHRDLKASNILLDCDMNPKISDFGLARTVGGNEDEASTSRIYGTYGYMAPEYALQGLFSFKSDVFSFGVLMLEIISGRKNSFYKTKFTETLIGTAWTLWCEERGKELIDPHLEESVNIDEAMRCIDIALLCIQEDAATRPTMSSVLFILESDSTLPKPTRPAYYKMENKNRMDLELELSSSSAHASSSNQLTLTTIIPR